MNEVMGRAMADLVSDVGDRTDGPPADLWRRGARRRHRSRAAASAVFAVLAALAVFVSWPTVSPGPEVPATPPPTVTQPRTYPSVLAHPFFAPDVSTARKAMTAVVAPGRTAYALDERGSAWRLELPEFATFAALSPNGRWVVDGERVHDLVSGTRSPQPHGRVADEQATWGVWSPDSALYAVAYAPSGRIAVASPQGGEVPVPALVDYVRAGFDSPVAAGWLDGRTLMVVWNALEGPKLKTTTWTVGARGWTPGPDVTLPDGYELDLFSIASAVSPDGRTLALSAFDTRGARYHSSVISYDLSSAKPGAPARATAVTLPTTGAINGFTWRDGQLLVTVGGRTGRPGQAPVVTSGSGFAGPTSWRADALAGEPYVNTEAIWRARLFIVLAIALGLLGVWLLWRGALWGARRLGIIDGPLPLRADLGWWRRA